MKIFLEQKTSQLGCNELQLMKSGLRGRVAGRTGTEFVQLES